jgi:tetratricopeptide (TPR) repeat protein/DNA-binding XRE family transcriptional regulator
MQASSLFPQLKTVGQRLYWYRVRQGLSQEALAEAIGASARSIRRWEADLALPHEISRVRLCDLFKVSPLDLFEPATSLDEVQQSPSSTPFWTVPFPRNPCFTGRETVLQTLHSLLDNKASVALTQASALSGLGGIGKTQVAIEYAYRYVYEYSAVFWLAAETSESLMGSLQLLADQVKLPEREGKDQSRLVAGVRRWLTTHQNWLVIADNVEDLDLLQSLLSSPRTGMLLLTTRRQALGHLARLMELSSMDEKEGIALLLARSQQDPRPTSEASESSGESLGAPMVAQAAELIRLLEGLPLAIDQAGAYLQETGCQVADYVQRYRQQRKEVLARRGIHGGNHPASVTTTVLLAVEQSAREHHVAPALLRLCAFLQSDAIPEEMLVAGAPYMEPELESALADPYQFDLMLAALRSASLVSRHPRTKTLSVHRLVQAVLRDQMKPAETSRWSGQIVRMLNAAFPTVTFDAWAQCERCVAHVFACLPLVLTTEDTLPEAGELLFKTGSYLKERGRLTEAAQILEQSVALMEKIPHASDRMLSECLEKLAEICWLQGHYQQTEHLLQRVLRLNKQELGDLHPRTAETRFSLGQLYWTRGLYQQAEPLFLQALHTLEQIPDEDPLVRANMLDSLGLLYWSMGHYQQAEPQYIEALKIYEQHLVADHPDVATTLNNLGLLYWSMGRYQQAEPLLRQALAIREEKLGSEHPFTATCLHNLATLFRDQGKDEQAEQLFRRALAIREQQFGPEHPHTAATLHNLATLYLRQGRYGQAEPLYQHALAICEQQLGSEHPQTATVLYNFACLYSQQNRVEQAEQLSLRACSIRELQLGPEHPDTLRSREQLIDLTSSSHS